MARYLLHQNRSGAPIGVFSEKGHFYFSQFENREAYGVSVVESRGPDTPWDEWVEAQASKSPSPTDMWDIYDHANASLETVLRAAKADTSI